MSAVAEARKHPHAVATPPQAPGAKSSGGNPGQDPVWAAMMDGLSTYIRDHERLYRLLAR